MSGLNPRFARSECPRSAPVFSAVGAPRLGLRERPHVCLNPSLRSVLVPSEGAGLLGRRRSAPWPSRATPPLLPSRPPTEVAGTDGCLVLDRRFFDSSQG